MQRALRAMSSPMYWIVTTILVVVALVALFAYAPLDPAMGPPQKILYVHLPAALNTFLGALVIAAAGVAFLWSRKARWDALAAIAAYITVALCSLVLLTGMIWGHYAWGRWWTWSPSLSFSLVLWLLYVGYIVLRRRLGENERRATVCAVYGIIAALDVPLVYLSVKLIPDVHPPSIELTGPMRTTLLVWTAAGIMITVGLIATMAQHRNLHASADQEEQRRDHMRASA
ncbi:MAG: cytochrome c biogenesis protein CcsA [Phycisphaerales bacterium]|nr:cytochrome c biogenesis protein CcsA [Phycisphaerales bacterium]